jgi:tape measure domain-containing protein
MVNDKLEVGLELTDKGFTVTATRAGEVIRTFTRDLSRTATALEQIERRQDSVTTNFRHFMMTVAAVRFALMDFNEAVLAIPKNIIKVSGEMERLTKLMEGLSTASTAAGRKAEAADNFKLIMDTAQKAPFTIKALTDSFVKLKSAGLDNKEMFLGLAESVAKFGGDSDILHRASIAIQQIAGKGVVSMEELRQQLGEAIPNAMQMMAASMGLTVAQLTKAVSKGTVEARGALDRFKLQMLADNEGAAREMMNTWVGQVQRFQTGMTLMAKAVGDSEFFDEVKKQMDAVMGSMNSVEGQRFAKDLGRSFAEATRWIATGVKTLIEFKDTLLLIAGLGAGYLVGQKLLRPMVEAALNAVKVTSDAWRQAAADKAQLAAKAIADDIAAAEHTAAQKAAELVRTREQYAILEAEHAAHIARIAAMSARLTPTGRVRSEDGSAPRKDAAFTATLEGLKQQEQAIAANMVANAALRAELDKGAQTAVKTAEGLKATGVAAVNAAARVTMLERAGLALRGVFTAMGGWLGIVITALSVGIELWMQYGETGSAALKKIQNAAKDGTGTEEILKQTRAMVTQLETEIESAKKKAEDAIAAQQRGPMGALDARGAQRRLDLIADQAKKELTSKQKQLEDLVGSEAKIRKDIGERANREAIAQIDKEAADRIDATTRGFKDERAAIDKEIEKLQADPKHNKPNDPAIKALIDKQTASTKAEFRAVVVALEKELDEFDQRIGARVRTGPEEAARKHLLDEIAERRERANQAAMKIGTTPPAVPKEKVPVKDPLNTLLEHAKEQLDESKNTLLDMEDGVASLETLRANIMARIERDRKSGKFDFKDAEDHIHARSKGFTPKEQEDANKAAQEEAIAEANKRNTRVEITLARQLAEANEQVDDAFNTVANDGYAMSGSLDKVNRELAKMRLGITPVNDELDKFDEKAQMLREKMTVVDSQKFIAEMMGMRHAMVGQSTADPREQQELEFVEQVAAVRRKWVDQKREIDKTFKNDTERNALETENITREMITTQLRMGEVFRFKTRTGFEKLADDWKMTTDKMSDMGAQWANGWVDTITEAAKTGKFEWRSMLESMLADVFKAKVKAAGAGSIGGFFDDVASWVGKNIMGLTKSANGNVMTPNGPAALRKYANGGIATSPQIALFGEGSHNEAYVPLPDGRSIPVTMQGSAAPNIEINVINQSGTPVGAKTSQPRFDGKRMVLDVVLEAASSPGSFRDGLKAAVRS